MSGINWKNVTSSDTVKELIERRNEYEKIILDIDSDALINYELEKLAEPQANGVESSTKQALPIRDVSQLLAFCEWYKTTDFNCEGNPPQECVDEYLKANCG